MFSKNEDRNTGIGCGILLLIFGIASLVIGETIGDEDTFVMGGYIIGFILFFAAIVFCLLLLETKNGITSVLALIGFSMIGLGAFIDTPSFMVVGGGSLFLSISISVSQHSEAEPQFDEEPVNRTHVEIERRLKIAPDLSVEDLSTLFPGTPEKTFRKIAVDVFKGFLNDSNFRKAKLLIEYHNLDEHNLLPVMESLELHRRNGELILNPKVYKIIFEPNETAFQKLPCDWQSFRESSSNLERRTDRSEILGIGHIYITDKRVFFVSKNGSESVRLDKIIGLSIQENALQIFQDESFPELCTFPTAHHAVFAELIIRQLMGPD